MSATLYLYEVTHPEYGTAIVEHISPDGAINKALKDWGGSWREDAAYCRARKLGKAAKPRCRRCHREYGQPGDPAGLCPECQRAAEQYRRDASRFQPVRRRPGE